MPSAWSAMPLPDSPICSTKPEATAVPATGSTSWNLIDDDPEFSTSTVTPRLLGPESR
ncbi:hypothetical protein C1Y40_05517 [Mycobacterium talmoniae]|uniref:Uncharacterized protein n=1 Tax=Mycobacterium talmoniae TaxID=1858794 RepID=A0A2S8BCE1_9MYCO|nr:hypothetical protein C1Y40_05517 [Mycobacterium talmoniae]